MSKAKKVFVCEACGASEPKWFGRCAQCEAWNSCVEEMKVGSTSNHRALEASQTEAVPITTVAQATEARIKTPYLEFNHVLGGGIVRGGVGLLGGEPGIGKSTLLLQVALALTDLRTLYVSGEESMAQIKMRAKRIGHEHPNCLLLAETNLVSIFTQIEKLAPDWVIVDSIQTTHDPDMDSAAGSVGQLRSCAQRLTNYAKAREAAIFLVGHITKEGLLAGPKVLEHIVDTVLQFEGDTHHSYRILRSTKNRFGATHALGVYQMESEGLKEITHPSELLQAERPYASSGVAIGAVVEGHRPLLVEVQTLVTQAHYLHAQRVCSGYDAKRLALLLALLEKRTSLSFGNKDVFVNLTGGLRIEDPALDLAICMALASSLVDEAIASQVVFSAEVGLGGEIRPIPRLTERQTEAQKRGLNTLYLSGFGQAPKPKKGIQLRPVKYLSELITMLFSKEGLRLGRRPSRSPS